MNSVGWEQAVLGTALQYPETMEIAGPLRSADFTGTHQILWLEMLALYNRDALEPRALAEVLRASDQLDRIGGEFGVATGEAYIADLMRNSGTAMQEYVDRLLEAAVRRELRQVGGLVVAEALDQSMSAETVMANAEARLFQLRRHHNEDADAIGDILGALIPRIDGMRNGTIEPAWVPEITGLRRVLSYLEPTDFMIIAGRPGDGKSSIMRFEFFHAAMRGKPGLIFNLENDRMEYARALVATVTGIDSFLIRNPSTLGDPQLREIRAAAERLASMPLYIKTVGSPTAADVVAQTRKYIQSHGVALVGVDYVQLMQNKVENTNEDITTSSQALRALALNAGVPVIACAQLSRYIEHRGVNADPMLSDLRGSGSLEQDATTIVFTRNVWNSPSPTEMMQFPENLTPDGRLDVVLRAVPIRMHVAKNRNGPIGVTDPIKFIKSTGVFQTLTNI